MNNINVEGKIYLWNGDVFSGKIEDGKMVEGTLKTHGLTFEGSWEKIEIEGKSYDALVGKITRGEYTYIGKFEVSSIIIGKITSYGRVKKIDYYTGEFVRYMVINERAGLMDDGYDDGSEKYSNSYDDKLNKLDEDDVEDDIFGELDRLGCFEYESEEEYYSSECINEEEEGNYSNDPYDRFKYGELY